MVSRGRARKAMASTRGVLEFDAHARAYGGHATVESPAGDPVSLIPLRHGIKTIGVLAAVAPGVDLGTLDAVAGVAAIAIERVQFLHEREAAEIVRQKADLAATLLASLSHDLRTPLTAIRVAVENLREESMPVDARARAGARGAGRAGSPDAPLPGHPRHGADRRARRSSPIVNGSRPPTSSMRRPRTSGTRSRGASCALTRDVGRRGRGRSAPRVGGARPPARERRAVLAGRRADQRDRARRRRRLRGLGHRQRARDSIQASSIICSSASTAGAWRGSRHSAPAWGSRSRAGCWRRPAAGLGRECARAPGRASRSSIPGATRAAAVVE